MLVKAPGLFSTTTFQPSPSDNAFAITRARISGGVEADDGTTIRMTFDGNDCADAPRKAGTPNPSAAAPVKNTRLSMVFPRWFPARRLVKPWLVSTSSWRREAILHGHSSIILLWHRAITSWNDRFPMPWNDRIKRRIKLRDL